MNDSQPSPHVLVLSGSRHRLVEVLQQAKMAPTIKVKVADLNDGTNPDHVPSVTPPAPTAFATGVVFYKQHGKYTALLGQAHIEQLMAQKGFTGEITGKLLSSPSLKKTRIEEIPVQHRADYHRPDGSYNQAPYPRPRPPYRDQNNQYANRPRFRDDRDGESWRPGFDNFGGR